MLAIKATEMQLMKYLFLDHTEADYQSVFLIFSHETTQCRRAMDQTGSHLTHQTC